MLANSSLILDEPHQRILSVFRLPARLGVFSRDGQLVTRVETCGDSDDAFINAKRNFVYVICGAGYVDVLSPRAATYERMSRIETLSGARQDSSSPSSTDSTWLLARAIRLRRRFGCFDHRPQSLWYHPNEIDSGGLVGGRRASSMGTVQYTSR
jgi:hypothetical protein